MPAGHHVTDGDEQASAGFAARQNGGQRSHWGTQMLTCDVGIIWHLHEQSRTWKPSNADVNTTVPEPTLSPDRALLSLPLRGLTVEKLQVEALHAAAVLERCIAVTGHRLWQHGGHGMSRCTVRSAQC